MEIDKEEERERDRERKRERDMDKIMALLKCVHSSALI